MPSNRPVKMDEWGITWEEYKELSYFCLQYRQKQRDAAALLTLRISTPPPAVVKEGGQEYGVFLPRGSGMPSDPVAALAMRREKKLKDVRMIESACRAAVENAAEGSARETLARAMLAAVTERGGVEAVYAAHRPPIGKNQFYALRRKFFWILREMREGDLEPDP